MKNLKTFESFQMNESIGLSPDDSELKGKTPDERIKNYIKTNLSKTKVDKQDAADFNAVLKMIQDKDNADAADKFWNMDTSVRDTFVYAYTNDDKDKEARQFLKKIFKFQ